MQVKLLSFEVAKSDCSLALRQRRSTKVGELGITELYYISATKQSPEKSPIVVVREDAQAGTREVMLVPWTKVITAVVAPVSLPKHQPFGTMPEYDTPSGNRRQRSLKTYREAQAKKGNAKASSKQPTS